MADDVGSPQCEESFRLLQRPDRLLDLQKSSKRVNGIEPAWPAWMAGSRDPVCAGERLVRLFRRARVTTM